MAIKVNGTTVIDDSRNLVNIASGAGSSTAFGAVGTYAWGRPASLTSYALGATASGLKTMLGNGIIPYYNDQSSWLGAQDNIVTSMSGTWRHMSMAGTWTNGGKGYTGLWVRIS